MGDGRVAYMVLVGKSKGRRQLGTQRHKWEVNIKMDFRGV
jgi:hypothetical protein